MQKFLFKISTIIILSLTPNILIGIIRSSLKDPIPFVLNFNNHFLNRNEQDGRINMAEKSAPGVNDMNKQKEFMPGKEFVIRVYDKFGFSNVHQNRSPEIIFIGDSFLDDKFESSLNGIQSLTNKRFNKNISYNIGKEGCAGFKVYNELLANYFEKKPRLIIFEVVERNAMKLFLESPKQLELKTQKTDKTNYFFFDLILADNFKDLFKSNLFNKTILDSKLGVEHLVENKKIWFFNDTLTRFSNLDIKNIIISMKHIKELLKKDKTEIIFLIAPDKESMFPEIFGKSNLETLQNEMKTNKINFIDMYTLFLDHGVQFYSLGDTHWNGNIIKPLTEQVFLKYNEITDHKFFLN